MTTESDHKLMRAAATLLRGEAGGPVCEAMADMLEVAAANGVSKPTKPPMQHIIMTYPKVKAPLPVADKPGEPPYATEADVRDLMRKKGYKGITKGTLAVVSLMWADPAREWSAPKVQRKVKTASVSAMTHTLRMLASRGVIVRARRGYYRAL